MPRKKEWRRSNPFRPVFVLTSNQVESPSIDYQSLISESAHARSRIESKRAELSQYQNEYENEIKGLGPLRCSRGRKRIAPNHGKQDHAATSRSLKLLEAEQQARLAELEQYRAIARQKEQLQLPSLKAEQELYEKLSQKALQQSHRGILSEYLILHEIIKADRNALIVYVLVCLLLLFWEILPLALKYTGNDNEYQRHLELLELTGQIQVGRGQENTSRKRGGSGTASSQDGIDGVG